MSNCGVATGRFGNKRDGKVITSWKLLHRIGPLNFGNNMLADQSCAFREHDYDGSRNAVLPASCASVEVFALAVKLVVVVVEV